ncbi:MAG: hypothetical protein ACLTAI_09975 [Thomasclavelia sp.]
MLQSVLPKSFLLQAEKTKTWAYYDGGVSGTYKYGAGCVVYSSFQMGLGWGRH